MEGVCVCVLFPFSFSSYDIATAYIASKVIRYTLFGVSYFFLSGYKKKAKHVI